MLQNVKVAAFTVSELLRGNQQRVGGAGWGWGEGGVKLPMVRVNASFQGVRRLFVLAYVIAAGAANDEADIKNNKKYFFSRRRN